MTTHQPAPPRQRRAARGQIMIIFGLTLTVLIGGMMLGVDLSRLRTEAENAQRAANAAALAGVVFLPNFPSNATYRAQEEATKNGFTSGRNGVSLSAVPVSGNPDQLTVSITEPVSLIFGGVLGLGPQTISRSATAEYDQPLQMGAPDYVLGYSPFPTHLVGGSTGATQGFYLEARGPYGYQENGDAYSQYYESFNGVSLRAATPTTNDTNPCATPAAGITAPPGNCTNLTPNPDDARIGETNGFAGYDYVVDNPGGQTLVIKIFDAYDEGHWQDNASTHGNPNAPKKIGLGGTYGNEYIDQDGCNTDASGTHFCPGGTSNYVPVDTQFTLYGPYQSAYDTNPSQQVTVTATTPLTVSGPGYTCPTATTDCVVDSPFLAGDDPTYTYCNGLPISGPGPTRATCFATAKSPYAYKFLNYAIIHGKGLYHIHVQTTANKDGTYGTGGNVFGIAACADITPALGSPLDPAGHGPGMPDGTGVAVSSPASNPPSVTWDQTSCPDPNAAGVASGALPSSCSTPGLADSSSCVHIYAVDRMCLYNNLAAGGTSGAAAVVPLGYVPAEYAGRTLHVRLYDVGDIGGLTADSSVEVLTPAGDTANNNGTPVPGTPVPPNPTPMFPSSLPYSWNAAPTDLNSGFIVEPTVTAPANQAIGNLGSASGKYNGTWLNIDVQIPSNNTTGSGYSDMVRTFGGFWKMLYLIGPNATGNDTTTWEISVTGAPVHLVTP